MKARMTARAVGFQNSILILSQLHQDQQIVDGLNEFIVIRQVHEGILRQLLVCRVRVLTRDGISEIILRFMRENLDNLAIQVMCCQILNRKNEQVPAGAFCVGEPAMVCRALSTLATIFSWQNQQCSTWPKPPIATSVHMNWT